MKCLKCNTSLDCFSDDEEIVCVMCGASFTLEYLGYYPEGSDERIDTGFEDDKFKEMIEKIKESNKR